MMKEYKWKSIKRKETILEIVFGVLALIIITIGIILDATNIYNYPFVPNLRDATLTVLQVQSTISTIAITLLALIGAFVSQDCQGISITDYYLRIKPTFLKQITIILGLLILCGINILLYFYSLFNIVIAINWVAILLIIFSAIEIYSVFKGKMKINTEIDKYVDYVLFCENVKYEKKINVFASFSESWSRKRINRVDNEIYLEKYRKAVYSILNKNDIQGIKIINEVADMLIKRQSSILDKNNYYRAYIIFEETYAIIWSYILHQGCRHIESSFHLYSDCIEEISTLIREMPLRDLEKNSFPWGASDNIIRVSLYCNEGESEEEDTSLLDGDMENVGRLLFEIGNSLGEHKRKSETISANKWNFDSPMTLLDDNVPKELLDKYKRKQIQLRFTYYFSVLKNNLEDIAKTVLNADEYFYEDLTNYHMLFNSLVFCYTYYIGEKEDVKYISQDEKKLAKALLKKWEENSVFTNYVETISCESEWMIDLDLFYDMDELLSVFERLPNHGEKTLILKDIIKDYYIFFNSMIIGISYGETTISNPQDDFFIKETYNDRLKDNYTETNNRIIQLFDSFSSDENYKKNLQSGFEKYNETILNYYKEILIKENREDYEEFDDPNKKATIIKDIKREVKRIIDEGTKKWTISPEDDSPVIKFEVLNTAIYTKRIGADLIKQMRVTIENDFLTHISKILLDSDKIDNYERTLDEEKYYDLIKKTSTMIGPNHVFNAISYKNRKTIEKLINDNEITRVYMGQNNEGLMLLSESIPIKTTDISVSFKHIALKYINYQRDGDSGLYTSKSIGNGKVKFTKDELEEYIFRQRMIIVVSIKIQYQLPEKKVGYRIIRKK